MARRILGFNENDHTRVSRAVKRVEAMRDTRNRRQRRFSQDQAVKFYNNTNETMPAYGVGAVTGVVTISGEKYLQVEKPDSTLHKVYLVNSGSEVPRYTIGRGYTSGTVKVLYDTGTPAVDEGWGPKSGQWTLNVDEPQISYAIGVFDSTEKVMYAQLDQGSIGVKLQGTAKNNWRKQDTDWPSAYYISGVPSISQIGYVIVDNVTGYSAATEFRVYLPTSPGRDPNVVDNQLITFEEVPGIDDPQSAGDPYYEATCNYDDDAIGTVKMLFATSDPTVQPGWKIADGTQDTARTFTGAAVDMTGRYPYGNAEYTDTSTGDLVINDADIAAALTGLPAGASIAAGANFSNSIAASGTDITITNYRPKDRGVYFLERFDNSV